MAKAVDKDASKCWFCKFVADCNKECEIAFRRSKLYKGVKVVNECSRFELHQEQEVITVKQLSELCGMKERNIFRMLSINEDYAIHRLSELTGKKIQVERLGKASKRKFIIRE